MEKNFYQGFIEKYFLRKPILSEEQRNQFETNLGGFRNEYDIKYRPGKILLRPKGLEKKL